MNAETANIIRDRIRQAPQQIRVLCPRGHFIADVTLCAPDASDIWMLPRWPRRWRSPQPRPIPAGTVSPHGFDADFPPPRNGEQPPRKAHLFCMKRRCRYSGLFAWDDLAVELGAAALAGHAEHVLTV